jgi:hypothetical protein
MYEIEDFEFYRGQIRTLLRQFALIENANFWLVSGTIGDTIYGSHHCYSSYASSSISLNFTENHGWKDFYYRLIQLLDTLIEYRSHYVVSDHYHCIVSVDFSAINVEWVDGDVAEIIIAVLKESHHSNS